MSPPPTRDQSGDATALLDRSALGEETDAANYAGDGRPALLDKPAVPAGPLLDQTPLWVRTPRSVWLVVLALGAWFWYTSWMPLGPGGAWGDLAYGRWIWEHGRLPAYEPLVPLAEGMPVTNRSWLAQLAFYGVYSAAGVAGIALLHSALLTLGFALYLRVFYRLSGRLPLALAALLLVAVVGLGQFSAHGPAAFGHFCLALVLLSCWRPSAYAAPASWAPGADGDAAAHRRDAGVTDRWGAATGPSLWLVPAAMLLWANTHASFALGIAVLFCAALGSLIDARRALGSWEGAFGDPSWRQRVVIAELGLAATFVNPQGVGLWRSLFDTLRDPIVAMFPAWQPLRAAGAVGVAFVGTVVLLLVVLRLGRRRLSAVEVLALAVVGALALRWSGMTGWWGVIVACVLVRHVVRDRVQAVGDDPPTGVTASRERAAARTGRNTVLALGLAWVAFAYSSVGLAVLRGAMRPGAPPHSEAAAGVERSVSWSTPRAQTLYMHANLRDGLVFNSYEWGDWLLWAGPRGIEVFASSRLDVPPAEVWRHYVTIAEAQTGWDGLLDFYGVDAVVVDFARHRNLIALLRESPAWRVAQEDALGIVAVRAAE